MTSEKGVIFRQMGINLTMQYASAVNRHSIIMGGDTVLAFL